MSETKHTPAPWTFDDGDDPNLGETQIDIGHQGVPVASVYGSLDFPCGDAEQEAQVMAECRANAYLIAAAPELLAALKAMDDLVEKLWGAVPWGKTFDLPVAELNAAPLQAKRAINAAEGSQP